MSNAAEGASASPEDLKAPDSWEVADVEESMKRMMLSTSSSSPATELDFDALVSSSPNFAVSSSSAVFGQAASLSEEAISQVPRAVVKLLTSWTSFNMFIKTGLQQKKKWFSSNLNLSITRIRSWRLLTSKFRSAHSASVPGLKWGGSSRQTLTVLGRS